MTIKVLDQEVVMRIAAGEVVERPASVVKELVENSIDAGASHISVEVRGGGTELIRVTDNGTGIKSSEIELAFQRYATSKISRISDLDFIQSLGFRGEALPSIAAVAEVEVVTATTSNPSGTYARIMNGSSTDQGRRGRAKGTTITVKDLLRNVPARLKFLKKPSTESSRIADIVTQYALAYPEVRFSLSADGRAAIKTPGSGQLLDSILEIYGAETARKMLELSGGEKRWQGGEVTSVKVKGMVGSPTATRSNRNYMSFFVNRRYVNSRLLVRAVEDAYHGLLMQGKHPVAVINVEVPAGEVDVNVHPTKIEVKFRDEKSVFTSVQRAVRSALVELAPVPGIEEVATAYGAPPKLSQQMRWTAPVAEKTPPVSAPDEEIQPTPLTSLPALRLLGQIGGTYIIAEGPEGLFIIDQHAAHERIVFEKVMGKSEQREMDVQGLLEPSMLEVNPSQDEILKEKYADLSEFGFAVEPFGERTYLVRAVPAVLYGKDWNSTLKELLDSLTDGGKSDWREKMAISIACHSAVRAGQTLSHDEMTQLIRQLEQTDTPNTCPHGRPTIIRLSSGQLEKEFRRT